MDYAGTETKFNQLQVFSRIYVMEYLKDHDVAKASKRSGLRPEQGQALMNDQGVLDAIAEQAQVMIEEAGVDAQWMLNELVSSYKADVAECYDPGTNTLLPIHQWPVALRRRCNGITTKEIRTDGCVIGHTHTLKMNDSLKILEMVGKHVDVNAFLERTEITTSDDVTKRLIEGRKRAFKRNSKTQEPPSFV